MARTARSAATERAYLHFGQAPHVAVVVQTNPAAANAAGADEEFDEADIWGAFAPAEPPRAGQSLTAAEKPAPALAPADGRVAHGSLPIKIPDWSKILGPAYRPGYHHGIGGAGDWEVDDEEDSVDALVPPHVLVGRRRAASLSLSLNQVVGRTLKVRDAVWMQTTGFQD